MTGPPGPPTVLVAEDEPLASMALRAQLEALDLQVLGPARNGDEAIALGACFPIDAALFDFRMPRRTGIEAAADLFDLAPTPVVLLTGVGSYDLPDPLPRPPIFEVVPKPAGLADLRTAIDAALQGFRSWIDQNDTADEVARSLADRDVIARAVRARADGARLADTAIRLLQDARAHRRALLDIARDILAADVP